MRLIKDDKGSVFFDVMMGSALLLVFAVSFIPMFVFANETATDGFRKTNAAALAEKQLNVIKSLPYDNIGLVGGNPGGVIDSQTTVTSNGTNYTIKNRIRWVDDPADSPDSDVRDYKKVTVEVSWQTAFGTRKIKLSANIARQSEQQISTNGNIRVIVKDTEGLFIEDAEVSLTTGPSAPQSQYTDENGEVFFADITPSVTEGDYTIAVAKSGYVVRPDQVVQTTTVVAGETRVLEFIMGRPGRLTITLKDPLGNIISKNCKVTLTNPYAGDVDYSSSNGYFEIDDLFPGNWEINPFAPSYEYTGDPITVEVNKDDPRDVVIIMTPRQAGNLHLEVYDNSSGSPISNADVELTNVSTSEQIIQQTNVNGVLETQLEVGNWEVKVSKTGYIAQTTTVVIASGNNFLTVNLNPSPTYGSILVRAERSSDGAPRPNVRIRVVGPGYDRELLTDSNGYALFNNLTPNNYTVRRWRSGWVSPRVVTVTAGQQSQVVYRW